MEISTDPKEKKYNLVTESEKDKEIDVDNIEKYLADGNMKCITNEIEVQK